MSECPAFSDYGVADNENVSENRNYLDGSDSSEVVDAFSSSFSIHLKQVLLKRVNKSCNILLSTNRKHLL